LFPGAFLGGFLENLVGQLVMMGRCARGVTAAIALGPLALAPVFRARHARHDQPDKMTSRPFSPRRFASASRTITSSRASRSPIGALKDYGVTGAMVAWVWRRRSRPL